MAKVLALVDERRIRRFGKPGQIPEDWEVVYGLYMTDDERLAAAWDADYLYTISVAEVSAKLPEALAAFGPMLSGLMGNTGDGKKGTAEPKSDEKPGKVSGQKSLFGDPGNRNRLLGALKPYLSPERGVLIDRALSAMQFGEMLGNAGENRAKGSGGDE